jgi:uncharacterized SAM-binding protein YcdF (DUF218 family)
MEKKKKSPAEAKKDAPVKKRQQASGGAKKQGSPKKKPSPEKKTKAPVKKKKTMADRTVARKERNTANLLRWIAMVPLGIIWYAFTFVWGGYSFTALVAACLIGILLFYNVMSWAVKRYPKPARVVKRVFTVLLCIGLLICGITECLIIKASFGEPEESCQYMLVLGAKVRYDGPSVSLMDRINAAYDYMVAHPEVIAIVSGGQGPDEPMTEARCMYEQLVKKGIDPERIWMEEKATSTWENINFALDMIQERTGQRPEKIGLLSSEYHLFRATLFADKCGVDAVGIPAKTSRLSQKINHFMREVAGIWHYILLGGQYD